MIHYLNNLDAHEYLMTFFVLFCLVVAYCDSVDTKRFFKELARKYGSDAPSILNNYTRSNMGITREKK